MTSVTQRVLLMQFPCRLYNHSSDRWDSNSSLHACTFLFLPLCFSGFRMHLNSYEQQHFLQIAFNKFRVLDYRLRKLWVASSLNTTDFFFTAAYLCISQQTTCMLFPLLTQAHSQISELCSRPRSVFNPRPGRHVSGLRTGRFGFESGSGQ
jgi:hypothetical protein